MPFHTDLVGTLFVVWGMLTALMGASMLALGVGGFALFRSAPNGSQFAASLAAGVFTALAVMAIIWGVVHIAVGVPLRRRRPWSRLAAMTLGSVDLVLLPFGTALGCYALVILVRDDARRLFQNSEF